MRYLFGVLVVIAMIAIFAVALLLLRPAANTVQNDILSIPSGEKYIPISILEKCVTVDRTGQSFVLKDKKTTISLMLDNLFYDNGEYEDEFSTPPFEYDGEVYLPIAVLEHLEIDIAITDNEAKLTSKDGGVESMTCHVTSLPLAEKTQGCHPIVDFVSSCVIGGYRDGAWLSAETMAQHIHGKETYRLYSLDASLGTVNGGPLRETEGGGGIFISTGKAVKAIGIDCSWDALPRRPKVQQPGQPDYLTEVTRLASMHGIASKNEAVIHQLIRADIDNDQVEEVIICAANKSQEEGTVFYSVGNIDFGTHATGTKSGDYAVVIIRKVIDGQVHTYIPAGIFCDKAPEAGSPWLPREYEVAGILDVDGDGQQEILIRETIMFQMNIRVLKFHEGRFWHVLRGGWAE